MTLSLKPITLYKIIALVLIVLCFAFALIINLVFKEED